MRVSPFQPSFASGEISPLLYGRPDFVRYQSGLRRCRGFVPLTEGVATRLPGTRYFGNSKDNLKARDLDFVFSDEDSYSLEFTDGVMRVWRAGALVESSPGVPFELAIPYTESDIPNLQTVQSADRVFIVDGRNPPQRLNRFADDNWTIEETPFEGGPLLAQNIDESLTVVASATTGAVTLTASSALFTAAMEGRFFGLVALNQDDVPYWTGNEAAIVGDRYRYDDNVYEIVSFAGGDFDTGVNPPTHLEGDWLNENDGAVWRFIHGPRSLVKIVTVSSPTTATATVEGDELAGDLAVTPTYRWNAPAWTDDNGYPRAIGSFEDRVYYGGTSSQPRTIWATAFGSTLDMSFGELADDAFSHDIAAGRRRQNQIYWIEGGGSGLHIGMSGQQVVARPLQTDQVLGLGNIKFRPSSGYGSLPIEPEVVDGEPVFVSKTGRRLHGLRYEFENDRVIADDLTLAARHILTAGAVDMAWQSEPWPVLWFALADGALAGLTFEPQQQVIAWHVHTVGGGGAVESVSVKPSDDGKSEELWLWVRRFVNGATVRFHERMEKPFWMEDLDSEDIEEAWHQFAAIRYEGAATDTIAGLGHLEGETVLAWTEKGAFEAVVSGGAITLDEEVTSAIVGLDASPDQQLRTLSLQPGVADGGSMGRLARVRAVGARLYATGGGYLSIVELEEDGGEFENPETPIIPVVDDPFQPAQYFSGVVDLRPEGGHALEVAMKCRPAPGAPITLAGVTPTANVTDN